MPALLLDSDLVVFEPNFDTAIAVGALAAPVPGSGLATADGRAVCHEADVTSVTVTVAYSTPACPTPGSGRITIESLENDQLSSIVEDSGEPVVLASGRLTATLEVLAPATGPPPSSVPDQVTSYRGSAQFQSIGSAPDAD